MKAERQQREPQQADPIQSKRERSKLKFIDNRPQTASQTKLIDSIQKKKSNIIDTSHMDLGRLKNLSLKIKPMYTNTVQRVIEYNENVTESFINEAKGISEDIKLIIEEWESSSKVYPFSTIDNLINQIMATRTHDLVSDILGVPLNADATKPFFLNAESDQDGRNAGGRLGEVLADIRGINHNVTYESDPETFVSNIIFMAASGVVLRGGVCDNFAALSAVIMKIIGLPNVKLLRERGHSCAFTGDIKVDPWQDYTHQVLERVEPSEMAERLKKAEPLEMAPGDIELRFFREIAWCKEHIEFAKQRLTLDEQKSYERLFLSRNSDNPGNSKKRRILEQQRLKRLAEISARRRR